MAAYGVGGEPNEVHELYGPMGWDNGKISEGMDTRFKVEDGSKIRAPFENHFPLPSLSLHFSQKTSTSKHS
jgi:hypothetical protein